MSIDSPIDYFNEKNNKLGTWISNVHSGFISSNNLPPVISHEKPGLVASSSVIIPRIIIDDSPHICHIVLNKNKSVDDQRVSEIEDELESLNI